MGYKEMRLAWLNGLSPCPMCQGSHRYAYDQYHETTCIVCNGRQEPALQKISGEKPKITEHFSGHHWWLCAGHGLTATSGFSPLDAYEGWAARVLASETLLQNHNI